ncbi:MAG TPA: helix-turn-helix domain-containing protein [Lacunisphaera sp.]|nr:helix-turn-helix domain-containing protein [Lacunisphaera sp.]
MTPEQKRIADKIRASRESLGLTQQKAADHLEMSLRTYVDAEKGRRSTKAPLRAYEIAGIFSIYAQIKEGFAAGAKKRE